MFSEPRFRVGTKADDGNYYIDVKERFNEGIKDECDTDRDSAMTTFS